VLFYEIELLTNVTVVESAVKFVEGKKKEKEDSQDNKEPTPIEQNEDLQKQEQEPIEEE
jgi:hypothetical protein